MGKQNNSTRKEDLSSENRIDELCDEFEELWKKGEHPDISATLERSSPDLRSPLIVELIRIDMEYRSNLGESVNVDTYVDRFPEFRTEIEELAKHQPSPSFDMVARIQQIGSLSLKETVGVGAFGIVRKAWDSSLEREVAVKLPTEKSLSREYAAEFHREAKAAAKLKHKGIVRVINYDIHEGIAYIVYDLIDGVSLSKWRKQKNPSQKQLAEVCSRVADALAHAHGQGVIHRDLKPSNILIDRGGNPYITDFGLAKRTDSISTVTGTETLVGTLPYMSPEQVEAKVSVDARTDIYAMGAILYELISGKRVIEGEPREAIHKILSVEPTPLNSIVMGVHPDLATICHKCLHKNRADRYKGAADLSADLTRFIYGEPIQAKAIPRTARIFRRLKKHYLPILSTSALSASLFVLMIKDTPPEAPSEQVPTPQVVQEPWTVHVNTEPEGAIFHVRRIDPQTDEPDRDQNKLGEQPTPATIELFPGSYQLVVNLPQEPLRSHTVIRTVPKPDGMNSPLQGKSFQFKPLNGRAICWETVLIPEANITETMVFVQGTDSFLVGDPKAPRKVEVHSFFVSPHEFTYGDYLKIRPGGRGNDESKPATEQPGNHIMPARWDLAQHWAEEAGGRLLTEIEFEYLAVMAAEAMRRKSHLPIETDAESLHIAGSSERDEIVLENGTIRGILSGYPEWTSSRPNSTTIWPPMELEMLSDYWIVRGENSKTVPTINVIDPRHRTAKKFIETKPLIGFRVARTVGN